MPAKGTWLRVEHKPADAGKAAVGHFAEIWRTLDRTVLPKLVRYKKRALREMFRKQGRAGPGTQRWPGNSDWTRRAKGFDQPLFSRPGHSGLLDSMKVFHRRRGAKTNPSYDLHLKSNRPYSAYIQRGYSGHVVKPRWAKALRIPVGGGEFIFAKRVRVGPMPARKHVVWTKNDMDWLMKQITKQVDAWAREEGA